MTEHFTEAVTNCPICKKKHLNNVPECKIAKTLNITSTTQSLVKSLCGRDRNVIFETSGSTALKTGWILHGLRKTSRTCWWSTEKSTSVNMIQIHWVKVESCSTMKRIEIWDSFWKAWTSHPPEYRGEGPSRLLLILSYKACITDGVEVH